MSDWIPIDVDEVKTEPADKPSGVEINLFLSPYDVPEAVRGFFDDERDRFVIAFRYVGDEPTRVEDSTDKALTLRIGKRSGRLYEIEVDVNRFKAQSVTLNTFVPQQIENALDHLVNRRSGHLRDNYSVAKEVLSGRRDQLFQDLAKV